MYVGGNHRWVPLPQMPATKKLFNFYSFPVSLGQVNFVLVLTSTIHHEQEWLGPCLPVE